MNLLLCMMGLPQSGKSTEARRLAKEYGAPMVNPDSIRLRLHGTAFYRPAEKFVWACVHLMVGSLFTAGHSIVILDATNTTRGRRGEWMSEEWRTAFHYVSTPMEVCIERALQQGHLEEIAVIRRMAANFEALGPDEEAFRPELLEKR